MRKIYDQKELYKLLTRLTNNITSSMINGKELEHVCLELVTLLSNPSLSREQKDTLRSIVKMTKRYIKTSKIRRCAAMISIGDSRLQLGHKISTKCNEILASLRKEEKGKEPLVDSAVETVSTFNPIEFYKDFDTNMKEYLQDHITDEELRDAVLLRHKTTIKRENSKHFKLFGITNLFGLRSFNKKKIFIDFAFVDLQGLSSRESTLIFMRALSDYYTELSARKDLTEQDKKALISLNKTLEAYRSLYLSGLIRSAAIKYPDLKEKLINLSAELLELDINAVIKKKKKRGIYGGGYKKHYTPVAYELDKEGNLIFGSFNLGAGSSKFHDRIDRGKRIPNEVRLGKTEVTKFGPKIIMTEGYRKRYLKRLCKDIVASSIDYDKGQWILMLRGYTPQEFKKIDPEMLESLKMKVQVTGNCSCRSQWAFFKTFHSRDGILETHHREIKKHIERYMLNQLKRPNMIDLKSESSLGTWLNESEVYHHCWADHVGLTEKGIKRTIAQRKEFPKQEQWKKKIAILPFCRTDTPLNITLESLFNGNRRVIIGRKPSVGYDIEKGTTYYSMSPSLFQYTKLSMQHLEMKVDDEGKVTCKVLGLNPVCVRYKRGEKPVEYSKDEEFVLEKSILNIQFPGDKNSIRFQ